MILKVVMACIAAASVLLAYNPRLMAEIPEGCFLDSGANPQPNEGATDETLYLPAKGTLNAVMIFVDFPDAPHSETFRSLYNLLVPHARRWYRQVSYGQLALSVTRIPVWYRMPKPSSEYGFGDGVTFDEHRSYIADAIAASDMDIDYSQSDLVYVVASDGAALPISPAFTAFPGTGVPVDGTEIRRAVTLGADIRVPIPNYGSHVLIHETGHLLGLPDLYDYGSADLFGALRFVGGWDVMSWVKPGAHFLLWHKLKFGWVGPDQVKCLAAGQVTEIIRPLEVPGGHKGIVVPTSGSSAYVVEVRQLIGQDQRLCDKGVLIYTVNAAVPNGAGPIRVHPAQTGTDPDQLNQCGPLYDAPFDLGPSESSTFSDPSVGLTVEVLSLARHGYLVRVTKE